MGSEPSEASSSLPWIWAIESLASFKQVDAHLLIDLVKRTPEELSDHLGKNAKEMASFRILESLSVQKKGDTSGVSSNPDSKVGFDPSESCEHVLRQILHKSSRSTWDVEPFIEHKRSCLPICPLQQLKAAILEGNLRLPTSLKERSGLLITNQSEGSSSHSQENLPARNLLPAKRGRDDSAADNHGGPSNSNEVFVDNAYDPCSNAAKKLKQDAICTRQAIEGQNSVSFHETELVEDVSGIMGHTGREGCDLSKEPQVGGLVENRFHEDGNDEYTTSNRLRSCDVDDSELLHYQQQAPCNNEKVPKDTTGEGQGQNMCVVEATEDSEGCAELRTSNCAPQDITQRKNSVDGSKEKCEHSFRPNPPYGASPCKAKDDIEHHREPELSSDGDCCHDERNDIAIKKHIFLSSQCTYSQDSLAMSDGTEQLCMKCNTGNQLLVCISDACPIVVHESCLGAAATFDVRGKFCCPFCAYSRAISEYMDVKKKASLARKDLTNFIGLGVEYRPKKFSKKLHRAEHNQLRQDEDLGGCLESNNTENVGNRVNNSQSRGNTEDVRQAEPSVSCANDDPPCGETRKAVTNGETHVSTEDKHEAQKKGSSVCCPSPREQEDQQIAVQTVQDCEVDNSSCRDTKIIHGSEQHAGIEMQQEGLHQPNAVTKGENCVPSEDRWEAQMKRAQEQQIAVQAVQDCEVNNSSCRNTTIVHGSEQHAGIEMQQKGLHQPNAVTNGETCVSTEDKREAQMTREQEEQQIAVQAVQDCEVNNSSCRDTTIVHGSEQHAGIEMKQEVLHQPNAVLPHKPVDLPSTDIEERSGEEKKKSIASNYSIRSRKRELQYTYPANPQLRRKKVPWTKVEEEALKEGVGRLTSKHDRSIPWKKILEFGGKSFEKGRTPMDLKDKWRNICKGSPKE